MNLSALQKGYRARGLSNRASRVYEALVSLSSGCAQVEASYEAISNTSGLARATVAAGIRELIAANAVTQDRRFASAWSYALHVDKCVDNPSALSSIVQVSDSLSSIVQPALSSIVQVSDSLSSIVQPDMNECTDDDECESHKKIRAIVSEFVSDEPWITELVHLLVRFVDNPDLIRAKGRESQSHQFKYPSRVAYKKLRALALGQPDPLPLFDLPKPQQPEAKPWTSGRKSWTSGRKQSTSRRLPQVSYTDEQRAAAEKAAALALENEDDE